MHARTTLPTALVALAVRQGDLFHTNDAKPFGISPTALRHNRRGDWTKEGPSVWSLAERTVHDTIAERLLHDARRRAFGVQLTHPTAVASDDLAPELRSWDGPWDGTATRHTAAPTAQRRRGWRARALPADAAEVLDGLRVTSARQTLEDLAASLRPDHLELCVESAARLGQLPVEVFGPPPLRLVLERRLGLPPTESMAETLFLQLVRRIPGLREPDRQVEVFDARGVFVGRVDFAWPELGIFVEIKGRVHDERTAHDDARVAAIVSATGWKGLPLRWSHLVDTPFETLRRLRQLLTTVGAM